MHYSVHTVLTPRPPKSFVAENLSAYIQASYIDERDSSTQAQQPRQDLFGTLYIRLPTVQTSYLPAKSGMLERAARHFEPGVRQVWQNKNKSPPSCRMLHASFWRHGAGDLNLPIWCFSTIRALFEPEIAPSHKSNPSFLDTSACLDGPFLDFLYPPKTRDIIKRLSTYTYRRWHRQRRSWVGYSARQYASSSNREVAIQEDVQKEGSELKTRDLDHTIQKCAGLENILQSTPQNSNDSRWASAWNLYSNLNEDDRSSALKIRLLHFLSSSPREVDSSRILLLFSQMPHMVRTSELDFIEMIALLRTNKVAQAVNLHHEALNRSHPDQPFQGTDYLLAQLVVQKRWKFAYVVWNRRMIFHTNEGMANKKIDDWRKIFFRKLSILPSLSSIVLSLVAYSEQHPSLFKNTRTQGQFLRDLVCLAFNSSEGLDEPATLKVLHTLNRIGQCKKRIFESACTSVLSRVGKSGHGHPELTSVAKYFALYSRSSCFEPSKSLLKMLVRVCVDTEVRDEKYINIASTSWETFHDRDLEFSRLLMVWHSRRGNQEAVQDQLYACLANATVFDIRLFYPLLHVHASCGDTAVVQETLEWMKDKFKLDPDRICYNILLNGYTKSNDMDGALACFTQMLQEGVDPEEHTLVTIMSLCADRGDVDFVNYLLEFTEQYDLKRTQPMMDTVILAQINDDDLAGAERTANEVSAVPSDEPRTRMWNQILAAYAIRSDLDSVLRCSKRMQDHLVKFDNLTYAALMRGFAAVGRPNMGSYILERFLGTNQLSATGFHYAILISGFTHKLLFEPALRIYARMLDRNITATLSTKLALLELHAKAVEHKYGFDLARHPGLRLDLLEEVFEDIMKSIDQAHYAEKGPQLQSKKGPVAGVYPLAFFDIVLVMYNRQRAYNVVKVLMARFDQDDNASRFSHRSRGMLGLINILMRTHHGQRNLVEVKRYWRLAKSVSVNLTKRVSSSIARSNQYILARPLDTLLRSLSQECLWMAMKEAIAEVQKLGFLLDNSNWNWYVQLLASGHQYIHAFQTAEQQLLSSFAGWETPRMRNSQFAMSKTPQAKVSLQAVAARHGLGKHGEFHLYYKTAVRLAFVYQTIRKQALANRAGQDLLETLQRVAPNAIRAVLDMPLGQDPALTHVLAPATTVKGSKRRMPV